MKPICLVIVLLALSSFYACKKECDDHLKFMGKYRFEVITVNWNINTGESSDTSLFEGVIAPYQSGDEYLDENYENQQPGALNDRKLTIRFLSDAYLLSAVTPEGILSPESGYHYHHQGQFDANGNVNFQITGLGGLGAGRNYYVKGTKLQD